MLCSDSPGPLAAAFMLCSDSSFTSLWFLPAEWYYQHNLQPLSFRKQEDNAAAEPVVYTPLHGVGLPWVQQVCCIRFSYCATAGCSQTKPCAQIIFNASQTAQLSC